MTLRERLLAHFREPGYSAAPESELVRRLGLKNQQRSALSHEVKRLLADKKLIRIQGGRLKLAAAQRPASSAAPSEGGGRKIFTPSFRRAPGATAAGLSASDSAPPARTPEKNKKDSARPAAAAPSAPASKPRAKSGELSGRIQFRAGGSAFVILENPDGSPGSSSEPSVQIFPEDTSVALPGDRVVIRIQPGRKGRRPGERIGSVVRVLERGRDNLVGNLARSGRHFTVAPDDPRFVYEIQVGDPAKSGIEPIPQPGDKVVVSLDEWTRRNAPLTGTIIRRLGRTHEPRAELLGVFEKYNLATEFPAAVEAEVARLPDTVQPAETTGRLDYRQKPVFTIDPDDAKDFDDALSYETLSDGEVRIGVHIADVSTYVKSGTALDREAQERGNSTYLVGVVIPMLPEKLSNGLCSLVEAQDRLCKAVLFTYGRNGRVKDVAFANTVIRSRKRLTYKQAYAFLKEDSLERIRALPLPPKHQTGSTGRALRDLSDDELTDLQTWVRALWAIASRLRRDRMAHGSLDLDMPETKIFVDVNGYADRLELIEHDESHQLIEEFMLAANEAVARLTRTKSLPSLYRVHDEPDPEKLSEFRQLLGTFNLHVGDLTHRAEVVKLLETLRTHPQGYTLRTQLLRSLKKACYRASPDGHYGLHKKDYTHFTSPIRRYSDLVVHRVLGHYLAKQADPRVPVDYTLPRVEALAEHLSLTEINSTEAERDSVKIKLLEFFERELAKADKTVFAAIITDVRAHGFFIELLESMTFGFIPANSLADDHYTLNSSGSALIGRRTKQSYAINGRLNVVVDKVDRYKRTIDFKPA
ncbi:MAG: RNB domain-containing ribonuclease [Verrucomicrobia bacterium]|nr:RNB domain-containing ribonuclease [Verrucomicrobiota bacterium]